MYPCFSFFFLVELRLPSVGFGARSLDRFGTLCAKEFSLCDGAVNPYPVVTVVSRKALNACIFLQNASCFALVIVMCVCVVLYLRLFIVSKL
jgi:hypothetical protein